MSENSELEDRKNNTWESVSVQAWVLARVGGAFVCGSFDCDYKIIAGSEAGGGMELDTGYHGAW